jgi:hypothetical protein
MRPSPPELQPPPPQPQQPPISSFFLPSERTRHALIMPPLMNFASLFEADSARRFPFN